HGGRSAGARHPYLDLGRILAKHSVKDIPRNREIRRNRYENFKQLILRILISWDQQSDPALRATQACLLAPHRRGDAYRPAPSQAGFCAFACGLGTHPGCRALTAVLIFFWPNCKFLWSRHPKKIDARAKTDD
ncbi:hypothetical protein, partial [Ralstonia solanacearum]|uniref:hypothetical protein n=1 Tax=Ralstonia solanacearum TaxID=305 RepID=UPI001E38D3E7